MSGLRSWFASSLCRTVVLTACGALAGCGTVEAHSAMLKRPTTPSAEGRVEIYLDSQEIGRPVEELGFVQAFGSGSMANPEDVVHALADRGAELGCDAIVRTTIDVGYTRAHAAGVCVKLVGPAPDPRTRAPYVRPALSPSPPPNRPPAPPGPQPRMESLPSNPRM